MDNSKIETKKTTIEQKFGELKNAKLRLAGQAQTLAKAVQLIDGEMKETQGAYKAVCEILGLDPAKESERVQKEWEASQAKPKEEVPADEKKPAGRGGGGQ